MKTATLADIVVSAQTGAQRAFMAPDLLARQSVKLAEFEASGFDRADFPSWESSFNAQMDMLSTFSKQPSVATLAAQRDAAPKV